MFGTDGLRCSARKFCAAGIAAAVLALATTGCKSQPWPLWDAYTARFVDQQGRVIDHNAGDRTTTEGQAYAMFFALVANDRARFDKLLEWTEANLAQGDLTLHLPSWSWGKGDDGGWHTLDANSASDADLWMAYSLCEAGRLWHVDRYTKLGDMIAARIEHEEVVLVDGLGPELLPGTQGFQPTDSTAYLNPSYLEPSLLEYFARRDPQGPWGEILASLPRVVGTPGGFAMDWMIAGPGGAQATAPPNVMAALQQGQAAPPAVGSFDAIRVYLWAGIANPRTPHVGETLRALHGMNDYLAVSMVPPQQVGANGEVIDANGPVGFSAAVVPYLVAVGNRDAAKGQQDRVAAMKDASSGLFGKDGRYYDQNLVLFEEGWLSGRFGFAADGGLKLKWK